MLTGCKLDIDYLNIFLSLVLSGLILNIRCLNSSRSAAILNLNNCADCGCKSQRSKKMLPTWRASPNKDEISHSIFCTVPMRHFWFLSSSLFFFHLGIPKWLLFGDFLKNIDDIFHFLNDINYFEYFGGIVDCQNWRGVNGL